MTVIENLNSDIFFTRFSVTKMKKFLEEIETKFKIRIKISDFESDDLDNWVFKVRMFISPVLGDYKGEECLMVEANYRDNFKPRHLYILLKKKIFAGQEFSYFLGGKKYTAYFEYDKNKQQLIFHSQS